MLIHNDSKASQMQTTNVILREILVAIQDLKTPGGSPTTNSARDVGELMRARAGLLIV